MRLSFGLISFPPLSLGPLGFFDLSSTIAVSFLSSCEVSVFSLFKVNKNSRDATALSQSAGMATVLGACDIEQRTD